LQTRAEDLEAQVEATTAQLKQLKTKQQQLEARNALLEIGNSDEKAQHIYSLVRYYAFFSQGNHSCLHSWLQTPVCDCCLMCYMDLGTSHMQDCELSCAQGTIASKRQKL